MLSTIPPELLAKLFDQHHFPNYLTPFYCILDLVPVDLVSELVYQLPLHFQGCVWHIHGYQHL